MSNDSNWDSGWNTSGSGNPWDFEPKDPLGGWESGSSGSGPSRNYDGSPERGYKNDVRISGILDKLGLGGRFVTCEQLEQLDLDEPIDYRAVTRTRKQLARQCLKRLTDALKG